MHSMKSSTNTCRFVRDLDTSENWEIQFVSRKLTSNANELAQMQSEDSKSLDVSCSLC